jgi:hypothetical protein
MHQPPAWEQDNQRALVAALGDVRAALERHMARARGEQPAEPAEASAADAGGSALAQLCAVFGLTPFERAVLLLCAGVELDSGFAALCAEAQGEPQRPQPTWSLALAALPGAHWSAITPGGPLRRWRLVEVLPAATLTLSPLKIDERVLHFLAGVAAPDERLAGVVTPVAAQPVAAPSHRALVEQILRAWDDTGSNGIPAIQLCGPALPGKRSIAAAAAAARGLGLQRIAAATLPPAPAELEALARLWEREAALSGSALLLECDELDGGDNARSNAAAWLIERLGGALFVSARERRPAQRALVTLDVARPTTEEQRGLWQASLGERAAALNGQVDRLVAQFNLDAQAIHDATAAAVANTGLGATLGMALWDSCRSHARPRLDDLAQRIASPAVWDDLVLPEQQRALLRSIVAHVRQRFTVYERWGFAAQGERGLGISALFAGPSGTGKTLAAEVLANELRLDLYRIDLSAVVSKYIGETEKNLRTIFDAAEGGGAVLLFDEADALFGKRSEVKDSHDRYANVEVSYLLQRIEAYRGLAVLTTNLKHAIDQAFLRRIRFVVHFPFPDPAQRQAIWRRVFPPAAPTAGLDAARLAQLNVAGGNIRSIALNAAFLAADAGEPVNMAHVLASARAEYAKLEKSLTDSELAGW